MYPVLLKLGPFTIYSWGFMVALGVLAAVFWVLKNAEREGITAEKILDLVLYLIIVSIIGARLFYVFQFWPDFRHNLVEIFMIHRGGLVFYGGFLAAVLVILIYTKIYKLSLWKILDLWSPATMLGYAIGRIGCFLQGCCYGSSTNLPWGVRFPDISGHIHPTQLYASLSGLTIFFILLFLYRQKKFDGQIFLWAVILYAIYRFLSEFIRINPTYIFGLTAAQLICIVLFVGAFLTLRKKT